MPCFHATSEYNHEPQCARVRGRVVWREVSDPDGDGDRHIVVLSRMRLRVVKLRADQALPGVGAEVEAVGFTTVGASGEREIVAEALRSRTPDLPVSSCGDAVPARATTLELIRVAKRRACASACCRACSRSSAPRSSSTTLDGLTLLGVRALRPRRARRVALKRAFDLVGAHARADRRRARLLAIALAIRLDSRGPGALPPDARRPRRPAVPDAQVPHDGARTPRRARTSCAHLNEADGPVQDRRRPAHHARRALPAPHRRSTSCRSSSTSCAAR